MANVTDYSTLLAHVADTLNRSDLTSVIPNFVQQFEATARRGITLGDGRVIPVRNLVNRGDFNVSADGSTLPTDIDSIESLYHDGPTYYGPITIIPADQIPVKKAAYGDSGIPQYGAITGGLLRWAPEPDATYTLKMTYWQRIVSLSATNTTNWLVANHPDIYLYGCLLEAAPYLKDDSRIAVWRGELERRVIALEAQNERRLYGGGSIMRHITPIGG